MIQMHWNLIFRLRHFFRWIWIQEGTPGAKARGLAIGVFCGCLPLLGFQTLLGITLASVFRGNHLLAVSATWISNPLTYLPLYWFNYRVGSVFLGQNQNLQDLTQFVWRQIWEQGWSFGQSLLLGSALVGCFFGAFIGLLTYLLLKVRSRRSNCR